MQCIVWDLIVGIWTESTGLIPIWWPIHQVAFVYFDTKPSLAKNLDGVPHPLDTREHGIMPWESAHQALNDV